MFDHLDDTLAAPIDDRFRDRTMRRGRRLRRRRRVAAGATACGSTIILGAAGLTWWGKEKLDDIDRVEIAGPALAPPTSPGEATTFLLVGSDSTGDMDPVDPVAAGRTDESNMADAIMLVRADPTGEDARLSVLSVPRDLWVDDADGAGTPGKINTTLANGGPELLVRSVSATLGVDVHHYVQLDMAGFRDVIDGAGGVQVAFAFPLRDPSTGFSVPGGECITLDGEQALAFVRSRHLEMQDADGSWTPDPTGDRGRMENHQGFTAFVIGAMLRDEWRSPSGVTRALDLLADHATVDAELSDGDLLAWGGWITSNEIAPTPLWSVPVTELAAPDGQAALQLADDWSALVDAFEAGTWPPPVGIDDNRALAEYHDRGVPRACRAD